MQSLAFLLTVIHDVVLVSLWVTLLVSLHPGYPPAIHLGDPPGRTLW